MLQEKRAGVALIGERETHTHKHTPGLPLAPSQRLVISEKLMTVRARPFGIEGHSCDFFIHRADAIDEVGRPWK